MTEPNGKNVKDEQWKIRRQVPNCAIVSIWKNFNDYNRWMSNDGLTNLMMFNV